MTYIAQKPCSFAGQEFRIGDEVPDVILHSGAIKGLIKLGIIAVGGAQPQVDFTEENAEAQTINIALSTESGPLDLNVTPEGLNEVFAVLMNPITDAEEIIAGMTDGDALILLHLADSRKTIKEAAEDRAATIEEEVGEQ